MPKRYYLSPDGRTAIMTGDGPLAASTAVPEGYRQVSAEEYAAALEAGRQEADARAVDFIANDGAVPEDQEVHQPVPLADLDAARAA